MEFVTAINEEDYKYGRKKEVGVLLTKGSLLMKDGLFKKALAIYEEAEKIDPLDVNVLANKGMTLAYLGEHSQALEYYDKSLKINPKYGQALYNKASCKSLLGNMEEALELLELAIKADKRCREIAKKDEEFNNLRNMPRFQSIIES